MAKNEAKIKFTAETSGFNSAIKQANQRMSELRAEMKLNDTQMKSTGTSVEGLEKKHSILANQLSAAQDKTEALSQKVQKAAEIYGENSDEASKLKVQLLNAQTAEERLRQAVDQCASELEEQKEAARQAEQGLDKVDEGADDASKSAEDLSESLEEVDKSAGKAGETLKKVGGVVCAGVVAGFTAAATAVIGLTKKSVESYADYEQLTGGVETLFADSANQVMQYAQSAFQTAGLSANEYMETVTSFSASLIGSLGGDTEKAAAYADRAIVDMSDNANKMGSDISDIQNAYQGFAKQNYGMLDNLKLGYGGTKEEMQRLLDDAEKLPGALGRDFDISNYADVVEAIHLVQTNMSISGYSVDELSDKLKNASLTQEEVGKIAESMGISYEEAAERMKNGSLTVQDANVLLGTTAKEASTTISGSIASMKSAWQNMLTAISSDDLPFDEFVGKFVDSVVTVTDNLIPRISIALEGVVKLVDGLAPIIVSKLPGLVSTLLPPIISAATGLMSSLVSALPSLVDTLVTSVIPQLVSGVVTIANALVSSLPSLMETIVSALPTLIPVLIDGLVSMISTLASNFAQIIQPIITYLPQIIISIVDALMTNLPILIEGCVQLVVGIVAAMPQIILGLIEAIPTILVSIVEGLIASAPILIEGVKQIWDTLVTSIQSLLEGLWSFVTGIWTSIKESSCPIVQSMMTVIETYWTSIWNYITTVVNAIKNVVVTVWNSIKNVVSTIVNGIKNVLSTTWEAIKTVIANVMNIIFSVISGDWESVKQSITNIVNAIKSVISSVWNAIKAVISSVLDGIKNTVSSVFNGIKSTVSSIFNGIKDTAKSVWNAIKTAMTGPIDTAKAHIQSAIDAIKGFFANCKLQFPNIKLPHFSISGSFSLSPPSVPKLSVSWYKDGAIFLKPTLFNTPFGIKGVGEAGAEAVLPIDKLEGYISGAIEKAQTAVNFDTLAAAIEDLANRPIALDINGKRFAYATASDTDNVGGMRSIYQNRGLALE